MVIDLSRRSGIPAVIRGSGCPATAVLDELSDRGLLAVCGAVELEIIHSARTAGEAQRARNLLRGFDWLVMPDEVWDQPVEVQIQAVHRGYHRALSMADLLIAATAERACATVLHYDGEAVDEGGAGSRAIKLARGRPASEKAPQSSPRSK